MPTLIRFMLLARDDHSGKRQGILTAAADLRDDGPLGKDEHRELRAALDWFDANLAVPRVLGRTGHKQAISWFKPEAGEAISRMWALKAILECHDYHVTVQTTNDPGKVVYSDEWQLVAIPKKWQNIS